MTTSNQNDFLNGGGSRYSEYSYNESKNQHMLTPGEYEINLGDDDDEELNNLDVGDKQNT